MKVLCVFMLCVVIGGYGLTSSGPQHGKNVVCYVASWAVFRPGLGKFALEDLNPELCTHIVYSFAGLDENTNTIKSLNPWEDLESGKAAFKRLIYFKQKYPHLKVILAVGGWEEGSLKFSNMASKLESRADFITSVVAMLKEHGFDGLDLHWKFPATRDGKPYDKEHYVLLVKGLSEAFKPHGYILTAAFGAIKSLLDSAYHLDQLSPYLDFINVMCYDYHGTWDNAVGVNSPLRGMTEIDVFSVTFTVDYLISKGVPPHKLVLGVPFFGRTFILAEPDTKALKFGFTQTEEKGFAGPFTREAGFIGYNEICMETSNKSAHWQYHWHEQSSTPYLRDGTRVISYDNGRSLAIKVKLAMDKGLGGIMMWTVDMDDFKGKCDKIEGAQAYIDFVDRYHTMVRNPVSKKAVKTLNLPDVNQASKDGPSYVLKENRLHFRLPQPKYSNFQLSETINNAISLSIEEKRIEDEIAKFSGTNEIFSGEEQDNNGTPTNSKKIVCYFASWAIYRQGMGKFTIEDIKPELCSHLVYSFAGLDEKTNTIKSLDPWQDLETNFGQAGYQRFVALKQKHPHLKVTLSVGGWSEASTKFSNMASNVESRKSFVTSVVEFLQKYKFDGLDLNWEYPTRRGGKPYDRNNFVQLVKEISEAFKPHNLILSAALGAEKSIIDSAYDLAKLSPYLDLIYVMAFDYHGAWTGVVGINAPLKGQSGDDTYNVEYTIDYIISEGVPPHKLFLSLPLYGRTFLLHNPDIKVLEFGTTPTLETGFMGPVTNTQSFMVYYEICNVTKDSSSQWEYQWHERSSTPYLRNRERVISYDNGRSLANKVKLAVDKGLGGVMIWSVDMDDFKGDCHETNAYKDFVERHQRMVNDPLLAKALKNLDLLDINKAPKDRPSYVLKENQLHLRLPQPKLSNFALMQTIKDALTLSIEEKRIQDEITRVTKENEINVLIEGDSGSTSILKVFIVPPLSKIDEQKRPFFEINHTISFRFY